MDAFSTYNISDTDRDDSTSDKDNYTNLTPKIGPNRNAIANKSGLTSYETFPNARSALDGEFSYVSPTLVWKISVDNIRGIILTFAAVIFYVCYAMLSDYLIKSRNIAPMALVVIRSICQTLIYFGLILLYRFRYKNKYNLSMLGVQEDLIMPSHPLIFSRSALMFAAQFLWIVCLTTLSITDMECVWLFQCIFMAVLFHFICGNTVTLSFVFCYSLAYIGSIMIGQPSLVNNGTTFMRNNTGDGSYGGSNYASLFCIAALIAATLCSVGGWVITRYTRYHNRESTLWLHLEFTSALYSLFVFIPLLLLLFYSIIGIAGKDKIAIMYGGNSNDGTTWYGSHLNSTDLVLCMIDSFCNCVVIGCLTRAFHLASTSHWVPLLMFNEFVLYTLLNWVGGRLTLSMYVNYLSWIGMVVVSAVTMVPIVRHLLQNKKRATIAATHIVAISDGADDEMYLKEDSTEPMYVNWRQSFESQIPLLQQRQ